MFLKNYQIKVVNTFKQFYQSARETKTSFDTARKVLPENMRHTLNLVEPVFKSVGKPYKDKCNNGLGEYYPRIVLKVPTGGGKTLLAVEAIREYQNLFRPKTNGACGLDCSNGNNLHADGTKTTGQKQSPSPASRPVQRRENRYP